MANYRVYNDNTYPYEEMFKGDKIKIPAKGSIIMPEDDAVMFKGTFSPPVRNADGQALPESYKKIRIELVDGSLPEVSYEPKFVNPITGKEVESEAALEAELAQYKDQIIVDEEAEKTIRDRKKKTA